MDINIGMEMIYNITSFDCTPWKTTVKYLGIIITTPLDNEVLIKRNIDPLVKDIQRQLESWKALPILIWLNSSIENEGGSLAAIYF